MASIEVAGKPGLASIARTARVAVGRPRLRSLPATVGLLGLLAVCGWVGPASAVAAASAEPGLSQAAPVALPSVLHVAPFLQQGEKLIGAGALGLGEFGESVALSADGKTAVVGAPGDDEGLGTVSILVRTGSNWAQQGETLAGGEAVSGPAPAGTAFGASVAISADGRTVLVGAGGDAAGAGAAWVFTREGSSWMQQGPKLTEAGEEGAAQFGSGVALSGDGATALIGAPYDAKGVGAAWVFTREGSTWTQQGGKLLGAHEAGHGQFGGSVALSDGGDTALIGARADHSLLDTGAAWIFTRTGATWLQQGEKLTGSAETTGGEFASSVALSGDGETALIGGPSDGAGAGAAWAFTHEATGWAQQGEKLTSGEPLSPARFGSAVALSGNGTKALVGAAGDALEAGAAWELASEGTGWTRQGEKLTGGGEAGAGAFGASVALSEQAHTALVGGPRDGSAAGAVWAFSDGALEELPAGGEADVNGGVTPHLGTGGSTATATAAVVVRPRPRGGLGTASISSARLASLFSRALVPTGQAARIGAILRRGMFPARLRSFGPGRAQIDWWRLSRGAAHASKQLAPVLVATGKVIFRRAGTAAVEVKLTRAGTTLLRQSKHVALSAKGTFLPNGAEAIRASRGFVLVR